MYESVSCYRQRLEPMTEVDRIFRRIAPFRSPPPHKKNEFMKAT